MKPTIFFTLMRMLLSAVLLVGSTLLFTGCPSVGSLCPERTCNDLALVATAVDNGATANYKLTFQDIGLNDTYNVEAVDSVTNQVLYSSIGTTSRVHTFSRPFSWRTVKWTVTVMYCTEPQKTFTCTTYSKVDGGGITVIVVERTIPNACPNGLPLNNFPTYKSDPNDLPTTFGVECYKGGTKVLPIGTQSSEDLFLSLFSGRDVKITLGTRPNEGCTDDANIYNAIFSFNRIISNKRDLHQAIHDLLSNQSSPTPYGLNYASVTTGADKRVVRFLRYQ